jgi:hypothetical protein
LESFPLVLNSKELPAVHLVAFWHETQCGKEPMQASRHCDRLGATAACTLRLMEEEQRGDTRMGASVQDDAWFGSVKVASALAKQGYKAVLQIKTGHGLYPKNILKQFLKGHQAVFR